MRPQKRHVSIVKLLARSRRRVKAQDGRASLHSISTKQGNPEVVQLLIDAGHEVDVGL